MRILFRYFFKEFCFPLMYCFTGFISIYLMFELFGTFSRLMEARPGWQKTMSYFAGYLAPYFEWLAPACLMLATLYTMWNFCRHSEITAMRASGIGFFTIVKPLLLASVLVAIFTAWVNECYVPRHSQWAKRFRSAKFREDAMEQSDNVVYRNVIGRRTWNIGALVSDDAKAIEDIKVVQNRADGSREYTILADRAEYLDGEWWFLNPKMIEYDSVGEEKAVASRELNRLSLRLMPDFDECPDDFLMQNRDWAYHSVADRFRYLAMRPNLSAENRASYCYDAWAQIFAPMACIVITLFAIPAGIATGRQSVFRGIVMALVMFFAFYAVTIGCMVVAKKCLLSPLIAAALPDVVFLLVGFRMFWRQR